MSKYDDWIENRVQHFLEPNGDCLYCQRPADQHRPVGPLIVKIAEPDNGDEFSTHEFCNWKCLAHWMANQAGGEFVNANH
jgi:hypothetical protein